MALRYVTYLNAQNQPLYTCHVADGQLVPAEEAQSIEYDLTAYQAIDLIELILSKQAQKESGVNDCYLGSFAGCTPTTAMSSYAYVTSTRLRIIVIADLDELDAVEMKKFFRALAGLYARSVANPFYDGSTLETPRFTQTLKELVAHYDKVFRVDEKS